MKKQVKESDEAIECSDDFHITSEEVRAGYLPAKIIQLFRSNGPRAFKEWFLLLEALFISKVQLFQVIRFCNQWRWKFIVGDAEFHFQKLHTVGADVIVGSTHDLIMVEGLDLEEDKALRTLLNILDVCLVSGTGFPIGVLCVSYTPKPD